MYCQCLKDEGYIRDFQDIELRKGISNIKIDLKYYNGTPVIKKLKEFQSLVLEFIQKLMILQRLMEA